MVIKPVVLQNSFNEVGACLVSFSVHVVEVNDPFRLEHLCSFLRAGSYRNRKNRNLMVQDMVIILWVVELINFSV